MSELPRIGLQLPSSCSAPSAGVPATMPFHARRDCLKLRHRRRPVFCYTSKRTRPTC